VFEIKVSFDHADRICGTKVLYAHNDPFTYSLRCSEIRDSGALVWFADDGLKWIVVFEKNSFEYYPQKDLLTDGPLLKQKFGFVKLMAKIGNLKQ
jgi:hypothetical protein